jgi:hypothetical protein
MAAVTAPAALSQPIAEKLASLSPVVSAAGTHTDAEPVSRAPPARRIRLWIPALLALIMVLGADSAWWGFAHRSNVRVADQGGSQGSRMAVWQERGMLK